MRIAAESGSAPDRANTVAMRLYAAAGSTEAPTDHVIFTFKLDTGTPPGDPGGVAGAADAEPGCAADRPRD
jgi:hypothetical protein